MSETIADKLRRLENLHQDRVRLQREEEALAAELATSSVRGVRTAMARILEVSLEALRQRYGPVPSITDPVREAAEQ
ncbi:hypothetical protein ABT186_02310 [Streptomyces sp. NPDC001634]|uniref:hypothetical protein n=1 Tax=Streptomyces sp. NPDC001634 TaxID=3154390 RepID=UPI0033333B23